MAFIRVKTIHDKPYAYLVENVSTENGPRQKVKQYLGRIYEASALGEDTKRDLVVGDSRKEFLRNLILREMPGFQANEDKFNFDNTVFCPKSFKIHRSTKSGSDKETILSLHGGYLSSFTLQRLLDFKKSKDVEKDARILAKHFLEAGLLVSQEEFISFYEMI